MSEAASKPQSNHRTPNQSGTSREPPVEGEDDPKQHSTRPGTRTGQKANSDGAAADPVTSAWLGEALQRPSGRDTGPGRALGVGRCRCTWQQQAAGATAGGELSVRPLVASAGGSCGWTAIPWTPIQTACRCGAPSPSAAWHVPRRPACDQAQTKPLTSPSHIPARRSEHALKHVPLLSALQLVPMSQKTRARVPRLSEARLASPALHSSPTQAHTSFRAWAADLLTLVSFPQTAPHPVCMLHHLSTRFTPTPFRATASPWPVPWPRLPWPWVHLSPSGLTTWEHAVERARAPSPGVGAEAGRPGLQGCAWHRLPRRVCRSNGLSRMRGEGAA